jgi:2-oxoglutarate dehydrogenase E2 component (dihydrolipoamide succinyltransferase)
MKFEQGQELIDLLLPKLGESIVGATVVKWLKKEGEAVFLDEPLLEVSTDKVNSEIPSPAAGILSEIFVREDQEIEVGALLAKIQKLDPGESLHLKPIRIQNSSEEIGTSSQGKEECFSPAVLRLAQVEGIPIDLLRKIEGSGEGGRITKKDVERFAQARTQSKKKSQASCPSDSQPGLMLPSTQDEDRIALSGMRKAIAENMVRSFYEAPHASLVMEADVTDIMKMISREKERFFQTHGAKLSITSFLVQALTKSIQQFPMLNASLDQETIILKRYVNVGIAVNIEKGLIVPVIKNCHERNLVSIAKALADLSSRARAGKLAPHEVDEGTVTLTNFGMTGALIGVPIIRYPEVAIIGAGAVQKRLAVREDDSIAVRQMMYLTLTFDHRVIDGIYGCQFLAAFKQHLESLSIH